MENNEYDLEEGLNKMMDDLSLVDDEFVNSYFENESSINTLNDENKSNYLEEDEIFSSPISELEKPIKKDILNEIDDYFKLNDPKEVVVEEEKILKIIDNSKNGFEFFEQFEKGILND